MIRFWVILIFVSCSHLPWPKKDLPFSQELKKYKAFENSDFLDHLSSLGPVYLSTSRVKTIELPQKHHRYLEEIYKKVLSNNEQILKTDVSPKFHIIKSDRPFYFSLPKSQFFLSLGLLKKYVKNEQLLFVILGSETLRSVKGIYEKVLLIPKGFLTTDQMLGILKIPPEVKYNLNKWNFYVLRRTGADPYAILNWIQIQNKNALDFNPNLGGSRDQTREEYLFKNFLVKEGLQKQSLDEDNIRASKEFYQLLSFIRRH